MNLKWRYLYLVSVIVFLAGIAALTAVWSAVGFSHHDDLVGYRYHHLVDNVCCGRPAAGLADPSEHRCVDSGTSTTWRQQRRQRREPALDVVSEEAEEEEGMTGEKTREPFRDCRMSNCFNASLCRHGFLVHVHPAPVFNNVTSSGVPPVSGKYAEILRAVRMSRYYTDDPSRACLFVLAIDTLDRDRLSREYIADIQAYVKSLEWWRGGQNHVVFNLYSGTWPDYDENGLEFDVGLAMLAKASSSQIYYRPGFDISLPLFHKEHSFRGGEPGFLASSVVPSSRKYLLSFKGKRYLTGIGSETRNSLYHIHNGGDIILLTTCKHGKGWKNVEDKRCETDNLEYDK